MNEEEKKAIERLEKQLNFWKKQNIKNSDCEIILNLITKLQKENEEKDKQIDLMAEEITMTKPTPCTRTNEFSMGRMYMSKEEIKQYFERKVEDVKD